MRFLVVLWALLVGACAGEVDGSCDWTWIDEEWCLMDVCAEQSGRDSECHEGRCWCCSDGECWLGSQRILTDG